MEVSPVDILVLALVLADACLQSSRFGCTLLDTIGHSGARTSSLNPINGNLVFQQLLICTAMVRHERYNSADVPQG